MKERFGEDVEVITDKPPLPVRERGRAARIAELHAIANWFADNPDVPMPHYVQMHAYAGSDDRVRELAAATGAELFENDKQGGRLSTHFDFGQFSPISVRGALVVLAGASERPL